MLVTPRDIQPAPDLMHRRRALASLGVLALGAPGVLRSTAASAATRPRQGLDEALLAETLTRAASLRRLHTMIVARDGAELAAEAFRGPGLDRAVNVKSISKTVLSALVGVAIDAGILKGVDQPIAPVLGDLVPAEADPRVGGITVGDLLSMRAGLERTSGPNYGRWVNSADWVAHALTRPFVDRPGGRMLYSTGSYHLLSAMLTRSAGRDTLVLAREWLGKPLGIDIPPWTRDPQGIYLGGNNMALSPRALVHFGEIYRNRGVWRGRRVVPARWVEASWTPRTRSPFTGHRYGYGWFLANARGHRVNYGWGFGGQMVYVVPDLGLTVVMTSDHTSPSGRTGYARKLHTLLADGIVRAAELAT